MAQASGSAAWPARS